MSSFVSGYDIPAEDVGALSQRVGRDAPDKMKMMIARAVLPMPPSELGLALAVLARNEKGEISETATRSIKELPSNIVAQIVEDKEISPYVLDVFGRILDGFEAQHALLKNERCPDDTIRWMARTQRGDILKSIARNQRRLIREPRIIESLIANPATPTPTLAPVIEIALRSGVETGRIAGFRELAVAFFGGDLRMIDGSGPAPENEDGEVETTALEVAEDATSKTSSNVLETLLSSGAHEAPTEDEEDAGLMRDVKSLDDEATNVEEVKEEEKRNNMWVTIQDMGVAEKVRLAVMGNQTARAILIRDPKKMVSSAVMKSPRLTLKEVAKFAATKTISEDVVREIARNREWTKNYSIRWALLKNPKCPPTQALTFVRSMRINDIRKLAKARDVPAYVTRAARGLVAKRG